jgi:hypothetical protein
LHLNYDLCLIFYHLQFMGQLFVFKLWPLLMFYHLFTIFVKKNIKCNFN